MIYQGSILTGIVFLENKSRSAKELKKVQIKLTEKYEKYVNNLYENVIVLLYEKVYIYSR